MTGWRKVEAGHYVKDVTLTGSFHAERISGVWVLRYEGAHSGTVGRFDTLAQAKEVADG